MVMTKAEVEERIRQRKEVMDRVKRLIIERLRLSIEPDEIAEDAPLFGIGLGLDSVDVLEIVVGIEQEFGITVTDEDMQVFRSVNTIVDFIMDKLRLKEQEVKSDV